jgi:hypothetical protein
MDAVAGPLGVTQRSRTINHAKYGSAGYLSILVLLQGKSGIPVFDISASPCVWFSGHNKIRRRHTFLRSIGRIIAR